MTPTTSHVCLTFMCIGLAVAASCAFDGNNEQTSPPDPPTADGDSEVPVPDDGYVRVTSVIDGEAPTGGQAEILLRCFPPDRPPPFEGKALLRPPDGGFLPLDAQIVEATAKTDEYRMIIDMPPAFDPEVPSGEHEVWVTCNPDGDIYGAFDLTLAASEIPAAPTTVQAPAPSTATTPRCASNR
ncbi:MAG: hypothetical protein AAF945_19940 [Actinomycetota bacterium]